MKTKLLCTLASLFIIALNSFAQSWGLNGNSGTNTSTNFLGTIDKKGLVLRTNNIERLRITQNGYVGIGISNPLQKLDVNGNINLAAGSGLYIDHLKVLHTKGNYNIFVGGSAGMNNLGSGNTATGYNALSGYAGNNNTGSNNTAIGYNTLFSNSAGADNIALGNAALYSNTTGDNNTALGSFALYDNTDGSSNTAVGINALTYLVQGGENTAVGAASLNGYFGSQNVAVGVNAMGSNSSATDGNTACGYNSLFQNAHGGNNTAIGINTLYNNESGYLLTAVGSNADANDVVYTNSTAIGNAALITADNQVRIGNSDITSIGGYKGWTKISDGRIKTNIKNNVPGLAFINKLKPITYNLNLDAADKIVQRPVIKDKTGKILQPSQEELTARETNEQIVYTGFVAQDVEKAAKELNYDFSGVDAAKNDKDLYGLRYDEFVVPLVKAVQELSAKNDELKKQNEAQQKINASLQKQIDELKAMIVSNNYNSSAATNNKNETINLEASFLEQNAPNPFNKSTSIRYNLSSKFTSAKIVITDYSGKALKQFNISADGKGILNLEAGSLSSGTYNYALVIDGKLIDSKKMVLTK